MKKTLLTIFLSTFALVFSMTSHAKGESQAGGLPALAARVAALEAQIAALQAAGEPSYAGSYHVTLYETGVFGCNNTIDPAGVPYLQYFQPQGISSVTTRTATTVAVSDGSSLYFPEYGLHTQEMRLSGSYEEDDRIEGNFSLDVDATGDITSVETDVVIQGQMSSSGDSFSVIVHGRFEEGNCDDAFSTMAVGQRITD